MRYDNRAGGALALALFVSLATSAAAQPFAVGNTVEASPLALANSWQSCTVTGLLPSGDYELKCGPRGTEYVVQSRWVRPAAAPAAPAAPQPQGTNAPAAALPPPGPGPQVNAPAVPEAAALQTAAEQPAADQYGCGIGSQVTDRQNRTGTITGVRNGMCLVRLSDGEERTYLAWMLTQGAGGAANAGTASVATGRYECWASAGGGAASYYTLVDINIRSATEYADKQGAGGNFTYDSGTKRLIFASGPLMGQRAEYLDAGKIGLSSKPTGFFDMVCNLKA